MAIGSSPRLRADNLTKSFGDLIAVNDLSFEVAPGETFGLLGPNGAGKTTTISMVCGLLAPDQGSVTVDEVEIRPNSTEGRELIGYVPQELALYPDMSGIDNLRFFGRLYGLRGSAAKRRIDEVLEIVGLADRAGDRVDEYSGGMQRRLNIAAGMLHQPRLLILDEPTVGIDPQSRNAILDAVAELGDSGMSVVYTTHYMEEAERLCDRVGIVDQGRLVAVGTRRELVAMIGEKSKVVVGVDGDPAAAAKIVGTIAGVSQAASADNRVECLVDDGPRALAAIVDQLHERGLAVSNLEIIEPSLDTVFLHITGTALRD